MISSRLDRFASPFDSTVLRLCSEFTAMRHLCGVSTVFWHGEIKLTALRLKFIA